jgi:hypothetical protein
MNCDASFIRRKSADAYGLFADRVSPGVDCGLVSSLSAGESDLSDEPPETRTQGPRLKQKVRTEMAV